MLARLSPMCCRFWPILASDLPDDPRSGPGDSPHPHQPRVPKTADPRIFKKQPHLRSPARPPPSGGAPHAAVQSAAGIRPNSPQFGACHRLSEHPSASRGCRRTCPIAEQIYLQSGRRRRHGQIPETFSRQMGPGAPAVGCKLRPFQGWSSSIFHAPAGGIRPNLAGAGHIRTDSSRFWLRLANIQPMLPQFHQLWGKLRPGSARPRRIGSQIGQRHPNSADFLPPAHGTCPRKQFSSNVGVGVQSPVWRGTNLAGMLRVFTSPPRCLKVFLRQCACATNGGSLTREFRPPLATTALAPLPPPPAMRAWSRRHRGPQVSRGRTRRPSHALVARHVPLPQPALPRHRRRRLRRHGLRPCGGAARGRPLAAAPLVAAQPRRAHQRLPGRGLARGGEETSGRSGAQRFALPSPPQRSEAQRSRAAAAGATDVAPQRGRGRRDATGARRRGARGGGQALASPAAELRDRGRRPRSDTPCTGRKAAAVGKVLCGRERRPHHTQRATRKFRREHTT